jgi:hypothetical protein
MAARLDACDSCQVFGQVGAHKLKHAPRRRMFQLFTTDWSGILLLAKMLIYSNQ